jgi:hypothetical protein
MKEVFSEIVKGLCEVEICDKLPFEIPYQTNFSRCVAGFNLDYFKIEVKNCIPKIKLDNEEIEWAKDFLSEYNNPIAFQPFKRNHKQGTQLMDRDRSIPNKIIFDLVNELKGNGHDILQFGLSDDSIPVEGCIQIYDLPIRKWASCYHVIGNYLGADTGDCHLMLSVGGYSNIFIPPNGFNFNYDRILYREEDFEGEPIRAKYFPYEYDFSYDQQDDKIKFNDDIIIKK